MSMEEIVHRIATDAAFASDAREDLGEALRREGYKLNSEEFEALKSALVAKVSSAIPDWLVTQFSNETA